MPCADQDLKVYRLIWVPTGHELTLVRAVSPEEAIKMAPPPWRKYPADLRAELDAEWEPTQP